MGFESFQVMLRGGHATYLEADEMLRQHPHVRPDRDSIPLRGSRYYIVDDGQHVLEVALSDYTPVQLSCRFTLCHPPSVAAALLSFVRELMVRFGMEVDICEDVLPEHAHPFSLDEYAEFSAAILRYTAARRAEWVAGFGDEPMAATTRVAFERYILPQCQPVGEQK